MWTANVTVSAFSDNHEAIKAVVDEIEKLVILMDDPGNFVNVNITSSVSNVEPPTYGYLRRNQTRVSR